MNKRQYSHTIILLWFIYIFRKEYWNISNTFISLFILAYSAMHCCLKKFLVQNFLLLLCLFHVLLLFCVLKPFSKFCKTRGQMTMKIWNDKCKEDWLWRVFFPLWPNLFHLNKTGLVQTLTQKFHLKIIACQKSFYATTWMRTFFLANLIIIWEVVCSVLIPQKNL